MRNKVLHIITGLGNGGAEAVLYRFVFNDYDNEHIVISLTAYGKYGVLIKENKVPKYSLFYNSFVGFISMPFRLYFLIIKIKPQLIQTWMYHADFFGGLIGKIAGIKNIYWGIHNSTLTTSSKLYTRIIVKLCGFLSYYVPSGIISCSEKSISVHINAGYDRTKFICVNNGYSSNEFFPDPLIRSEFRNKYKIKSGQFVIGMVARFDSQKDPDNFFSAIKFFENHVQSDYTCVLVGPGMDNSNIELLELLKLKGIESKFLLLGQLNNINHVMNGIDLLVLSSRYGEAFPNVIAEAMLAETPCVTTDVGDSAILVSNFGWVAPPSNSLKLFECILESFYEFSNNQELWNIRKANCRSRIKLHFTIEKMISNYNLNWKK